MSASDKAANPATDTITIMDDTAAPTGQSITLTGATAPFYPGGPVTFSLTNGSDPSGGSGLDLSSATVTRETGTLAANNCSGFTPDGGTFTSPDNSTSSSHCYRYTFSIADKVGNVATSSVTAKVSPNAPTVSVDPPTVLTGAGNQYYDAGTKTQFFRPGGSGSFSLNATADDADTGVTHVAFPDVSGVSGWSGSTGGNDTTSPYASPADYTWTSGATAPGARSIVATNSVALTNSDTITLAADSAGPTGQSVTLAGPTAPYYGSASVSFTLADGNDGAGSGLDVSTRTVTRETGTLSGNTCTSFSPDAGTFTSPDTAVSAGHCYRYSFTIADKVGNISSAATATAKVDNGAPTVSVGTPTALTGAGNQYYDAGTKTLFFRSTGSGSFDLNATASDSDTAVDAVDFPTISSLSGWSGSTGGADTTSPYSSPTDYSWSSGAAEPGAQTVSATDKAANSSSDTITIADDTSAPTGQSITLTGAFAPYYGSNSVGFSLANGSDNGGGAGLDLASATVTRETGTLSGDSCSGFSADAGTFTSADTSVSNGHCYRYTFRIADKVANLSAPVTATAKVDTDNPTVSLTDPGTPVAGTIALSATASDPSTDIQQVVFERAPAGGSTWTAIGTDTTSPYTASWDTTGSLRRPVRRARRRDRQDEQHEHEPCREPSGRQHGSGNDDRCDAHRSVERHDAYLLVQLLRGRLDLRMPRRRRRLDRVLEPRDARRTRRRQPHLRRPGNGRRGQHRRDACEPHVGDRPHRTRHHDRRAARRSVVRHHTDLRVQLLRARLDLRMPHRRRQLDVVLEPRHDLTRTDRGQPHVRRPRGRRGRQHRRQPGELHVGDRPDCAGHDPRRDSRRSVQRHDSRLLVQLLRAGLDLRMPHRRWNLDVVLQSSHARPGARRRQPHVRGSRDGCRGRHRRLSRLVYVDGRPDAAGNDDRFHTAGSVERHDSDLLVQLLRGRLDLRMPHRRRQLDVVLEPGDARPARRRQPHVRRPRHGPGGQHRFDAGEPYLDGRPHGARTRRSTPPRPTRPATRRRPSRSAPPSPVRRSSAGSTAAAGRPARAPTRSRPP